MAEEMLSLKMNHSYSQKEYVDWKYKALSSIAGGKPVTRRGGSNRIAYRFYTRQHPELTRLLEIFYLDRKKIIPNIELDPLTLAVWYMDDGSKCRDADVYLNTQQFSFLDQERLLEALAKLGLMAKLNKDKQYRRIRFIKSSVPNLFNIIDRHVISSMR
jgi:hypothetical protein